MVATVLHHVSMTGHRTRKTRCIGSIGSHQANLGGTPRVGVWFPEIDEGRGVSFAEPVKAAGKAHGGYIGVVDL